MSGTPILSDGEEKRQTEKMYRSQVLLIQWRHKSYTKKTMVSVYRSPVHPYSDVTTWRSKEGVPDQQKIECPSRNDQENHGRSVPQAGTP